MDLRVAIGSWETPPTQGGPAYYIKELVERLSKQIEVILLVPSHAVFTERERLIVKKLATVNIPILRVLMFSYKASNSIDKLNVDLVHDNGILGFSNFTPFIETWHHGQLGDQRYISSARYYLSSYREQLTLKGLRKANSVIAISNTAKNELINVYSIPSSKISVIPHGVDTDFFKPGDSTAEEILKKENGKRYLLYVGSLSARKNLNSLIYALKLLVNKNYNLHLLIVGEGQEKTRLQELGKTLNLADRLIFTGSVTRERLLTFYNMTDYVVLPSFKEGFGMTILEALSCEKPVIMTPVGISDVVKDNHLGVVANGFTPWSLSDAIELAINSSFPLLRTFVKQNYSWDQTIKKTICAYRQAIEQM